MQTISIETLTHNLMIIANNATRPSSHFYLDKVPLPNGEGDEIYIRIKSISQRLLRRHQVNEEIQNVLHHNIAAIPTLDVTHFVNPSTNEMTALFIAAHKFNQTLLRPGLALCEDLDLPLITHEKIAKLQPLSLICNAVTSFHSDLMTDCPHKLPNGVLRYHKDVAHINHTVEAARIFLRTQSERIVSLFGSVLEKICGLFGKKITAFQRYHYFRLGENSRLEDVYSNDSPLSNHDTPSSYWLGHASCLLSIPLASKNIPENKIPVYVITDPVEGDLNALLYPRQTKIARTMESCPAPHIYLLSHNHLDHYSHSTIKKLLAQQPLMIVPTGDGSRFTSLGFKNVTELNWWTQSKITLQQGEEQLELQIIATPANHWAGQGPCGGHESTFLGYIIRGADGGDIYFAGDTARLHEKHVKDLRDRFNIRWMFQPGGPDEARADMESTHQASVDGLWMHFSVIISKLYSQHKDGTWEEFLAACSQTKTIYMHTKTYKLGNLHFDDTESSIEKVKSMLRDTTNVDPNSTQYQLMRPYEQQVYRELLGFADNLKFNGQPLTPQQVAELLDASIIVPKIGSRTQL